VHYLVTSVQNNIHLIEAVQRRAARFVVNCHSRYQSVASIQQELGWPTLQERRDQMKLIMMYKIIHGLVYIQHNLPLTYSNLNNISRSHPHRFIQPATRIDSYKHSYFPSYVEWGTYFYHCQNTYVSFRTV